MADQVREAEAWAYALHPMGHFHQPGGIRPPLCWAGDHTCLQFMHSRATRSSLMIVTPNLANSVCASRHGPRVDLAFSPVTLAVVVAVAVAVSAIGFHPCNMGRNHT